MSSLVTLWCRCEITGSSIRVQWQMETDSDFRPDEFVQTQTHFVGSSPFIAESGSQEWSYFRRFSKSILFIDHLFQIRFICCKRKVSSVCQSVSAAQGLMNLSEEQCWPLIVNTTTFIRFQLMRSTSFIFVSNKNEISHTTLT